VQPTLNVAVDKKLCVSNLWCVRSLPAVFGTDGDGRAEVLDAAGAPKDEVVEAAFGCPVSAIAVVDAQTGQDLLA